MPNGNTESSVKVILDGGAALIQSVSCAGHSLTVALAKAAREGKELHIPHELEDAYLKAAKAAALAAQDLAKAVL